MKDVAPILVAANVKRQGKEFFSLLPFVETLKNYPMKTLKDLNLNLKVGTSVVASASHLSAFTDRISIAFQTVLKVHALNNATYRPHRFDKVTQALLDEMLEKIAMEPDRTCTYSCELAITFPQWATNQYMISPMLYYEMRVDGFLPKTFLGDKFGEKTLENEEFDLEGSNNIFDHLVIPKETIADGKTIGDMDLATRIVKGPMGLALQELQKDLSIYNFHA